MKKVTRTPRDQWRDGIENFECPSFVMCHVINNKRGRNRCHSLVLVSIRFATMKGTDYISKTISILKKGCPQMYTFQGGCCSGFSWEVMETDQKRYQYIVNEDYHSFKQ